MFGRVCAESKAAPDAKETQVARPDSRQRKFFPAVIKVWS